MADRFTVRKIDPKGLVTTIGGRYLQGSSVDGIGSEALFADLRGIAVTGSGDIFVVDKSNNRVSVGIPLSTNDGGALQTTTSKTDSDGDGRLDTSEFLAGTDPYDPGSELSISESTLVPTVAGFSLDVEFPSVQGRLYRVEYSPNLVDWSVIFGPVTPVQGVNQMKVSVPLPDGAVGFVRVGADLD